jgi:Fe-S oxidoreductase
MIAADAARSLTASSPDELITACPLCKKTLGQATETKVTDIAELVAAALPKTLPKARARTKKVLTKTGSNG